MIPSFPYTEDFHEQSKIETIFVRARFFIQVRTEIQCQVVLKVAVAQVLDQLRMELDFHAIPAFSA